MNQTPSNTNKQHFFFPPAARDLMRLIETCTANQHSVLWGEALGEEKKDSRVEIGGKKVEFLLERLPGTRAARTILC